MDKKLFPDELMDGYSMGGKVAIHEFLCLGGAHRQYYNYSTELVDSFIAKAIARQPLHYPATDQFLYLALDQYRKNSKPWDVLIVGSEEPCYEAVAIAYNGYPTTIEYQKITSTHPKLKTQTIEEFEKDTQAYDGAISISSVEHSGLGRYGDPLDPDGDLKAMKLLWDKVVPGGDLYLAVPIGIDQVLFNAHRVYGIHRLPLLLKGWRLVATIGLTQADFTQDEFRRRQLGQGGAHQPVLVLMREEKYDSSQ